MRPKDPWYDFIPKVELHLHLEGAIPHRSFWELVEKYGGDPSVPTLHDLKKKFSFRSFSHFIDTWIWKNQYLREYEDFEYISESVANDLEKQNIQYAEIFYSPPDFKHHGLEPQLLTESIRKGLDKNQNTQIKLIADLVRDFGPLNAEKTLEEINEVKDLGILGIGLGGSENKFPPEPYARVFSLAKDMGFKSTVHAGEASDPVGVWETIQYLNPDRIGHGTKAVEDSKLVEYFVSNQVPIEICPISNLRTGIVSDIADHPVREFFEKGILVTINTDDPKMFDTSLAIEYRLLVEKLGFSKDSIRTVILNGIKASWLDETEKSNLENKVKDDPSW